MPAGGAVRPGPLVANVPVTRRLNGSRRRLSVHDSGAGNSFVGSTKPSVGSDRRSTKTSRRWSRTPNLKTSYCQPSIVSSTAGLHGRAGTPGCVTRPHHFLYASGRFTVGGFVTFVR